MTITDLTPISLAVCAALIAGLWVMWTYFSGQIAAEHGAREALAKDFADFKLEAARTYATSGAIEKSEERLAIAIDRLTARLETVIGRIETLSTQIARATTADS
jgi:hypothetical protein